jgi:hypothetical protein
MELIEEMRLADLVFSARAKVLPNAGEGGRSKKM